MKKQFLVVSTAWEIMWISKSVSFINIIRNKHAEKENQQNWHTISKFKCRYNVTITVLNIIRQCN